MVAVYVDTSAWYAYFLSSDARHAEALRIYEKIMASRDPMVSTDWVVLETVALIHRRAGAEAARTVCMEMLGNPTLEVAYLDEDLVRASSERYRSSAATISWVDAASFTAMDKLGITRAFAFDRDFASAGFTLES